MNVLVTGATGFLGRHLCSRLLELGADIWTCNTKIGNLHDYNGLVTLCVGLKFDYIFHLAASTKAGTYCLSHQGDQYLANLQLNTNILKFWHERQPQAKLIAIGTSCGYDPGLEKKEDNFLKGEPFYDLYTYAMTKRMLLLGAQMLSKQYGLKYLYYIPSTLYGPMFDVEDSHFIFDLIKKIYAGKNHSQPVKLWGTGNQKRELTYVGDAVNIIMQTLHLENESVNLCCGQEYSIKHYANLISDIYNYDQTKIEYDTTQYEGVASKVLCAEKLHKLLPNYQFTPLEIGIKNTIYYYNEKISANVF